MIFRKTHKFFFHLPVSLAQFYSLDYTCKNLPAIWETWVRSLGWEDPLEKGKATHSSILAWRSPLTVQSMGLQRVEHERLPELPIVPREKPHTGAAARENPRDAPVMVK